jgi:D-alanine-D-alanine ligase
MIVVAVLRGGPGDEHDISLRTGVEVLRRIQREPYRPVDVYIDRTGKWYVRGIHMPPERALSSVDVVFIALHGEYGEDGTVQRMLDMMGIPYTGSKPYGSALSMNKPVAKEYLKKIGVLVPEHVMLGITPNLREEALKAYRKFSPPIIVKPAASGSSIGLTLAKTFDDFWEGLKKAFAHSTKVMVEEFIPGREATAGIVEGLRKSPYYQMLPVEIAVPTWGVFDYDAKYGGKTEERVPGHFTRGESKELEELARKVHEELGLRHYSRSDFVVSPRGTYFLEANSLPTLIPDAPFAKSLNAVGVSMDELIDHLIGLAVTRK